MGLYVALSELRNTLKRAINGLTGHCERAWTATRRGSGRSVSLARGLGLRPVSFHGRIGLGSHPSAARSVARSLLRVLGLLLGLDYGL